MEVMEAIFNRRSIRAYEQKPIEGEVLMEIIHAGLAAPSGVNLQPWYFVVIQSDKSMRQLLEVMGRVSTANEEALKKRFPKHPQVVADTTRFIRQLGGAPVCILVFELKPDYTSNSDDSTVIQGIAASIQNMLLAATAKGIGSCWLTAPLETGMGGNLQKLFAPDKGSLAAIVSLGYSAKESKAPPRKDGRFVII